MNPSRPRQGSPWRTFRKHLLKQFAISQFLILILEMVVLSLQVKVEASVKLEVIGQTLKNKNKDTDKGTVKQAYGDTDVDTHKAQYGDTDAHSDIDTGSERDEDRRRCRRRPEEGINSDRPKHTLRQTSECYTYESRTLTQK